jgi:hypothetical protein
MGYTWRGGKGAILESWGPSVEARGYWDREDFWQGTGPQESEIQFNLRGSFRGNVGGSLSYSRSAFSFAKGDYSGLYLFQAGPGGGEGAEGTYLPFLPNQKAFSALDEVRFRGWIGSWEKVRISAGASWSETPIFDPSGVPADAAEEWATNVNLTFYPTGSLQAAFGVRHSRLYRQRDGSRYSTATIPRLQGKYQFTRALFIRGIFEYASQTRGEILDPESGFPVAACGEACSLRSARQGFDFQVEGLVGYEPSPGTVVFLGYSRQMKDLGSFRFQEVTTQADGLFLKVSYRFRM